MTPSDLTDRLTRHKSLGMAPPGELAWLAAHGVERAFQPGDVTTRKGAPEEWLNVVLSGRLAIHLNRGAGQRKIIEWVAGDVCGLMPFSRGGSPPGDTVVEEPTVTLSLAREHFPDMIRECPGVTARLVHAMLDRARHFTSSDLHDEKLLSLGKLAAGLAHELNNPASAATRSAKRLEQSLADAEAAARELAAARLSNEQLSAIDRVRAECLTIQASTSLSPVQEADRVETITGWLDAHGVPDAPADPLAATAVTLAALEHLSETVTGPALAAAVRWIAAGCEARALSADVERSSSRIYALVTAVKGFTYMDHPPTAEPVEIRKGITDTIAVLGARANAKEVVVTVDIAPDLPRVQAFGGELNQVWANLIDNALDAVSHAGTVVVCASRDGDRVVVRIVDNGVGIPPEHLRRIFDPFFTTKPVGQGTGLGLDIVRRLVQRLNGEIDVASRPGHTEFRVSLPAVVPS